MYDVSRRQVLRSTIATAAAVGVAGCSGGESSTAGSEDSDSSSSGESGETAGGSGPDDSPDPDCSRLAGSPTPYDASGTPFVFEFDYVDSWSLKDPLEGPEGRVQGLSSPVVSVDGEPENAGLTVQQTFEPVTAAEVDETIADSTSGSYARVEVLDEQSFDGESVRFVGFPDAVLPYYEAWLPYGDGEARYYQLKMQLLTSIIRLDEDNVSRELCVEETVAGIETVRESLRPNSDSTIEEV